jgi:uncharacterized protein (TIGR01777 family)
LRIAISGASGFIGGALVKHLGGSGHTPFKLVRGRAAATPDEIPWDPASGVLDPTSLDGIDAVVNFTGENLGSRWSPEKKRIFRESRLQATTLLAKTIGNMSRKPAVFVSASAIGIYGADRGNEELDEKSSLGSDFLATLCQDWEAATLPAAEAGIRVVNTRQGLALHPSGGVLEKLMLPFRMGGGGKLGSGDQWMSWIARTDLVDAVLYVIQQRDIHGPVNLTAPNPVTNAELSKTLGAVLHRPAVATVPAAFLRVALGREMADTTVLASQRVLPRQLILTGFEFRFPQLEDALRWELSADPGQPSA